jgi:hypothetical protein
MALAPPMPRVIIATAACVAAACSASTPSRPVERAELPTPTIDSVWLGHADVDLTGSWATGSGGEPAVSRIVLHPECNYSPATWVIQQSGDTVRAWAFRESYSKGTASTETVARVAAAEGHVSGMHLVMSTGHERYALHYDSTSGHLRGTLNGAPFWAVRQDIVRTKECPAVP